MASTYLVKNTAASTPKPTDMQENSAPSTFEGSYVAAKNALTTANSGSAVNFPLIYTVGSDALVHSFKTTSWMTPALATQSIASQTWTVKVWCSLSALPTTAVFYIYARLFVWNGASDSFRAYIGNTMSAALTQTTAKAYTLTTTGSASPLDLDRIGIELYHVVDDDPTEPSGGITYNIIFSSAARDTGLTSPATIVEFSAGAPTLMTLGTGL